MEKRISELLGSALTPDVKLELGEGLDAASAQRIKELTMSKVERSAALAAPQRRRTTRRVLAPVLACVIALFAMTTVAYATNAFGMRDNLREFFAGAETELSIDDLDLLVQVGGSNLPPAITVNGTTVTPIAAIAGEDYYYLALRIDAPEGVQIKREETAWGPAYYQVWGPDGDTGLSLLYPDGSPIPLNAGVSTSFQDDVQGDNSLVVVIEFDASHNPRHSGDAAFNDGDPKILTLHGLWLQSPDKTYTQIIEGVWEFDIGSYFTNAG
ncbi:MAG: hypothetical protein FWF91_06375 [Coriobacteriia bacterium]|nr:hypothetical protein [Coriobacteriia bacterium]